MLKLLIIVFQLSQLILVLVNSCPISWSIFNEHAPKHRCWCENHGGKLVIGCNDEGPIHLKKLFTAIYKAHGPLHFHQFYSWNSHITEIEEDVFVGASFDAIRLMNGQKLEKIHANAFGIHAVKIKEFALDNSHKVLKSHPAPYNTFDLLNSLKGCEKIVFMAPEIVAIPKNAFVLPKLKELTFGFVEVEQTTVKAVSTIGEFAFAGCDSLEELTLSLAGITEISINAFAFHKVSTKSLSINLSSCKLTGNHFKEGCFSQFKRPVILHLNDNDIGFFREKVFKPFLDTDKHNALTLDGNPIKCGDCKNYWLLKERKYKDQLRQSYCDNFKAHSIFDIWTEWEWNRCAVNRR